MADNGNFIAQATANSHGQFAAKAKKAGMSTKAFAGKVKSGKVKATRVTREQAQLAAELMSFHHKKAAPPMDAEDKIDHGVDEAEEQD